MSNVELTNIKSINITSSPTYSNTHFACFKSKNEKMVTFDKKMYLVDQLLCRQ